MISISLNSGITPRSARARPTLKTVVVTGGTRVGQRGYCFAPSVIRALEPAVRERAEGLVAALDPGETVDFVSAVSIPFPLMIISDLLGVPTDDWLRFFQKKGKTLLSGDK